MPSNDDARPVTVINRKSRYDRIEDRDFDRDTVDPREKRFYLALDDEVVRAPSIGNKTASRLIDVGVTRVRDLLEADPDDLSQRLGVRHISPQRIREWQAQARFVCTVPWLRGTHAQLLVGAGFPTADEITGAEPGSVFAAILTFAMTRDGQSVLKSGPPPDVERNTQWMEFAAQAEPARAA
jgi:predicted flap endonuclease-1-like 5' DNA nuclease